MLGETLLIIIPAHFIMFRNNNIFNTLTSTSYTPTSANTPNPPANSNQLYHLATYPRTVYSYFSSTRQVVYAVAYYPGESGWLNTLSPHRAGE